MGNSVYEESPLISVVSAYYNRQDKVIDSINSLLNQTYKNLEIIVIDDGSTDDTYKVLSSLEDPRLKVISQANQGFVGAIRHAISVSNSEFIAIHGAGDISLPKRIEMQVKLLMANPDIGVVGCHVRNFNMVKRQWDIVRPHIEQDQLTSVIKENPFTHGEVMFRRNCYDQVGGYREFFKFAQDRDLWLRMAPITRFAIVPEILYEREAIEGSVTKTPSKAKKQTYFSEFAVYCAITRRDKGFDPLDRDGNKAFENAFITSSRLPARLRSLASRYLADENIEVAKELMSEVISLDASVLNTCILRAIVLAQKVPILQKPLQLAFRWRLKIISLLAFK